MDIEAQGPQDSPGQEIIDFQLDLQEKVMDIEAQRPQDSPGQELIGFQFKRSRAFRRAWGLGGRPLAKEPAARKRDQHGGNIASKLLQNSSQMEQIWLPNGPWRSLGGLLEVSWSP